MDGGRGELEGLEGVHAHDFSTADTHALLVLHNSLRYNFISFVFARRLF